MSAEGRSQIARVGRLLSDVASEIPPEIDWVVRVDGHTDDTPLSGLGRYADNWELSQARALSVVRYMTEQLGFPPDRLAATGFGQYQPVADRRHSRGTGSEPPDRAEADRAVVAPLPRARRRPYGLAKFRQLFRQSHGN